MPDSASGFIGTVQVNRPSVRLSPTSAQLSQNAQALLLNIGY
jgi:hypothetical protein